jgi:hypothetical protein
MNFRATNFSVTILLLMAMTIFTAWWRNRKPLDNSWPLIYWLLVFLFTLVREEETYSLNIVLVGVGAGLMLRFEFMNPFFVRLVKTVELVIWCYVLYRGFQIIVY